ncbi:MAG: ankyrin repeat domain-containing protein [Rhizobiaceae bacterium]
MPTVRLCFVIILLLSTAHTTWAGDIHRAAWKGDIDLLAALISAEPDINSLDGEGASPLFVAAKMGRLEAVEMLLAAGADPLIEVPGTFGSLGTAIHTAAGRGHADIVRVLIKAGVDPNLPNEGVGPPLHVAELFNKSEVVAVLRSLGAVPSSAPSVNDILAEADPVSGEEVAATCTACHWVSTSDPPRKMEGPILWEVVGREKASIVGFAYSRSMREKGGVWDFEALNNFIANPRGFIPGTKMAAVGGISDPERRAALMVYLRSLSNNPAPLP